jgi:predicted nucleic acid-binding protein
VTVIDTSAVVDYLLDLDSAGEVERLIATEGELAAPDVVVFEALSALRRLSLRGEVSEDRGAAAVADLGELRLALFPSMDLRERAWGLRDNMTVADALFVALAEQLSEPLASRDRPLLKAITSNAALDVEVLPL